MKIWVLALTSAAALGLGVEEALADRSRHNSSSAHQSRHHQSRPQHQSRNRHHHAHPQRRHHHYSHSPARIVVVPAFPSYYYVPAPVIVAPPVVAAPPVPPSMNSGYWYFCPDSRAYYPYVLECPSGWLAVVPGGGQPPAY